MTEGEIDAAAVAQLGADERASAVLYVRAQPVAANARLNLGPAQIEPPCNGHLAFVDRAPLANWGHSCRFLVLDTQGALALSVEARFSLPPR